MSQMKEQEKYPEKEQSKMERSNLPDSEFKIPVRRMLSDLSENFEQRNRKHKNRDKNIKKEPVINEEYNN